MKSSTYMKLSAVLMFLVAFGAFAATTKAPAAHSHGLRFRGSVVSVDAKAKTFEAKDSAGKTATFVWNEATKAPKAGLTAGENVSVHYMVKDGKDVATVINVLPAQAASHTPSKAAPKTKS